MTDRIQTSAGGFETREYQTDGVTEILSHLSANRKTLYVSPTGSGKTVVAALVAKAEEGRVLIFSQRREQVVQTAARLVEAGIAAEDVGVLLPQEHRIRRLRSLGVGFNEHARIQVASIQTLSHRHLLPEASLVVVDEAHHAIAASYQRLVASYPEAKLLGLTATPWRMNGLGLGRIFDVMVCGPQISSLIEGRYLSSACRAWSIDFARLQEDLAEVPIVRGDYDRATLAHVVKKRIVAGDTVTEWRRLSEGRATVVFCTDVDHVFTIRDAFLAAGVPTEAIVGDTSSRTRDSILDRLTSGETKVVVSCEVFVEGWDAPPVKCAVMLRPTRSLSLYLQMLGRLLRPWGDVSPRVIDHVGNVYRHDLPHVDREWSLEDRRRQKAKAGVMPVKSCPECREVVRLAAKECPCGHLFSAESMRGPLVEVKWGDPKPCSRCGEQVKGFDKTGKCVRCAQLVDCKTCTTGYVSKRNRSGMCLVCMYLDRFVNGCPCGAPLGLTQSGKHLTAPRMCHTCAGKKAFSEKTPEWLSERSKKSNASMGGMKRHVIARQRSHARGYSYRTSLYDKTGQNAPLIEKPGRICNICREEIRSDSQFRYQCGDCFRQMRNATIVQDRRAGEPLKRIAASFEMTESRVSSICTAAGLHGHSDNHSVDTVIDEALDLRKAGCSYKLIAAKLEISETHACRLVKKGSDRS